MTRPASVASFKSYVAIGGLVIYVACFAFGLGPIFWLLISEIYPLKVRGAAMCAVTVTNWALNLVVAVTFLTLVGAVGHAGTFWLYGVIAIGAWVFFYRLVPETKGKSLEQIEEHWRVGKGQKIIMTTKKTSARKQLQFTCSLSDKPVPLPHFWEHTVGSGHAPLALRADWQRQLRQCHEQLGFRHVRFHDILSDDMGTLMDEQNHLLYSFFNADQICDFLLSIGMKPFVELSFMPSTLSSGSKTVFHYGANVTPPKDYTEWAKFVGRLIRHWVQRYGIDEVSMWFFEVWNEPNLKAFWTGTQADYFKLYLFTVQAIKEVDERLRVGGPATAKNEWITEFLTFCTKNKAPVDFVSTHHYPTDALGSLGEDTETQLAHSKKSILRKWARETHRKARGKPLYYTEWSSSSNPRDHLHDEPYTAAVIVKTMMEARGLVEGYSYWTFTDIFEENYMPATAFQGGFGLLTLQGVAKPSYRAFELLHRLGVEELPVKGKSKTVDVWAVAGRDVVTMLITNHALPRHPIKTESVEVKLTGLTSPRNVYIERIDNDHANAKRLWIEMGQPALPTEREVEQLHVASQIVREPLPWNHAGKTLHLKFAVPPQGIAAITVELTAKRPGENSKS